MQKRTKTALKNFSKIFLKFSENHQSEVKKSSECFFSAIISASHHIHIYLYPQIIHRKSENPYLNIKIYFYICSENPAVLRDFNERD